MKKTRLKKWSLRLGKDEVSVHSKKSIYLSVFKEKLIHKYVNMFISEKEKILILEPTEEPDKDSYKIHYMYDQPHIRCVKPIRDLGLKTGRHKAKWNDKDNWLEITI